MQLFINEEKVDFTLEEEKTLQDIVRSVEEWLAGQKLVIVGLEIDRKRYDQAALARQAQRAVTDIKEIKLTVSDFPTLEREGIAALTDFFSRLKDALAAKDDNALTPLLERFPSLLPTIDFLFQFALFGGHELFIFFVELFRLDLLEPLRQLLALRR